MPEVAGSSPSLARRFIMDKSNYVAKNFHLPPDLAEWLRKQAFEQRVPQTEIVRDALRDARRRARRRHTRR